MSVTEAQRHDLYEMIKGHWGAARAEVMMNLLPPVGWADVATKHDLVALESRLGLRIDALDSRIDALDSRLDRLDIRMERLETRIDGVGSRFVTWLLTSQATVVAATAAMIVLG